MQDERLACEILKECKCDCENCFFDDCHCLNQQYCILKEVKLCPNTDSLIDYELWDTTVEECK
jgi:hypothetical protein